MVICYEAYKNNIPINKQTHGSQHHKRGKGKIKKQMLLEQLGTTWKNYVKRMHTLYLTNIYYSTIIETDSVLSIESNVKM